MKTLQVRRSQEKNTPYNPRMLRTRGFVFKSGSESEWWGKWGITRSAIVPSRQFIHGRRRLRITIYFLFGVSILECQQQKTNSEFSTR